MRSYLEASTQGQNKSDQSIWHRFHKQMRFDHSLHQYFWKTYISVTITKLASSEIVSKGTKTFGSVSNFAFAPARTND